MLQNGYFLPSSCWLELGILESFNALLMFICSILASWSAIADHGTFVRAWRVFVNEKHIVGWQEVASYPPRRNTNDTQRVSSLCYICFGIILLGFLLLSIVFLFVDAGFCFHPSPYLGRRWWWELALSQASSWIAPSLDLKFLSHYLYLETESKSKKPWSDVNIIYVYPDFRPEEKMVLAVRPGANPVAVLR